MRSWSTTYRESAVTYIQTVESGQHLLTTRGDIFLPGARGFAGWRFGDAPPRAQRARKRAAAAEDARAPLTTGNALFHRLFRGATTPPHRSRAGAGQRFLGVDLCLLAGDQLVALCGDLAQAA
jgi:hypothetical protein